MEYPTTRRLGATAEDRAADVNAAFSDPTIRAILATIGGDDEITVIPHLNGDLATADPKIFLGYSDDTNLLNWLWSLGVAGYYGGATQVHLVTGPRIDDVHIASLRAALLTGGDLQIVEPGESEDFGPDWLSASALVEFGQREATEPCGHGPGPNARLSATPGADASRSSTSWPWLTGCHRLKISKIRFCSSSRVRSCRRQA